MQYKGTLSQLRSSTRRIGRHLRTKLWTKKVLTPNHLTEYAPAQTIPSKATLKNDDADDSEEETDDDEALAEQKVLQSEAAKRAASSKQPTGRVVGIIKRNWRS